MTETLQAFEEHRASLLGLAYRMLGDVGRAEDAVQEAWIRWQRERAHVDSPRAWLVTTVTRLCLDELQSAHARHEEPRGDRLPEPVDLAASGLARLETLDRISMAFVVVLQRLTPAERAVLLLHDVFDLSHEEVGTLLGKNDASSRQLLKRARESIARERAVFRASEEEVLIVDGGDDAPSFGRLRAVRHPIVGDRKVASVLLGFSQQEASAALVHEERALNGEPAVVAFASDRPVATIQIGVADGRIRHVFVQSDPTRLVKLGKRSAS